MSDQKKWFKLWHSALSDDALCRLPTSVRWAWVALGAHTKVHGERGVVKISGTNSVLAAQMGVAVDVLKDTILMLPHIHVGDENCDNGEFTVTWKNWRYFQEDSTVASRVSRLRSKRRGEEKRGEESRITPISGATPPLKLGGESGFKKTPKPKHNPPKAVASVPLESTQTNGNGANLAFGGGGGSPTHKDQQKPYRIETPGQEVVVAYKVLKGVEIEDRGWDRIYYPRFKRQAEDLLRFFAGDLSTSLKCLAGVSDWAGKKGLDWTLETVVKRASDWKTGGLWK